MIPCVGGASFARVEFGGCQLQSGEARGRRSFCATPLHNIIAGEALHKRARSRAHHPVIMKSIAKPLSGHRGVHFVERFPCDQRVERRSTTQV